MLSWTVVCVLTAQTISMIFSINWSEPFLKNTSRAKFWKISCSFLVTYLFRNELWNQSITSIKQQEQQNWNYKKGSFSFRGFLIKVKKYVDFRFIHNKENFQCDIAVAVLFFVAMHSVVRNLVPWNCEKEPLSLILVTLLT